MAPGVIDVLGESRIYLWKAFFYNKILHQGSELILGNILASFCGIPREKGFNVEVHHYQGMRVSKRRRKLKFIISG